MNSVVLKKLPLLLALAFYSLHSSGQLSDGNVSALDPVYSHQFTFIDDDRYYFIDTSFNSLHWYHQLNHTGKDIFEYSRLGNLGAALNPLSIPKKRSLWNYYDHGAYNPYFKERSNIPFYYTRSPLTEANYRAGYDRGQSFNIYHTQNINKRWNFMVNYRKLNALGFYTHNRNEQSSLLANTHYHNRKSGYSAYAYFLNETMEIQEWGGIEDETAFEENLELANPRVLMNVNLDQDMRSMRNQEVFIDQRIALNKLSIFEKKEKINSEQDSVSTGQVPADSKPREKKEEESENILGVGHSFLYSRKSNAYHGFSEDFYNNYYFSENAYVDSSFYRAFHNTFYVEGNVGEKSNLNIKAGIKNLVTQYSDDAYLFSGSNWGLTGSISGRVKDYLDVEGSVDYILTGPLNQSLAFGGTGTFKLYKSIKAFGGYSYKYQYPSFFRQFYISNNFIWENDFEREGRSDLSGGIQWGKDNKLELTNYTATNYVYFNENAVPEQSDEVVNVFKAELVQNFTLWNFLHQDNRVIYQTVGGNRDVLPLPEIVTRNSLYFEFTLFGHLKCIWGAEVKYFTPYRSPSYMPAIGAFYVANEREIGGYPLVDAFASFEILKARIFFKYEHANEGLLGYNYYAAPEYPFPDRVLRIGITWRFFN